MFQNVVDELVNSALVLAERREELEAEHAAAVEAYETARDAGTFSKRELELLLDVMYDVQRKQQRIGMKLRRALQAQIALEYFLTCDVEDIL